MDNTGCVSILRPQSTQTFGQMHILCQLLKKFLVKLEKRHNFAKLDVKSTYWQIALDEKAKELSIINTYKGLFSVNRLQMGMKNASAIFQRCIRKHTQGHTGSRISR